MKNLLLGTLFLLTATGVFAQVKQAPPPTSEKQLYETYNINLFRGVEGTWFDLRHDNGATGMASYFNILDWLQGRVAGLQVYSFRGIRVPFLRNQPAAIFVDEVRTDYAYLNVLPATDIALVKVMPSPTGSVANVRGGAIAIYTKRGEGEEEEDE